jgi:hypothetical protein
VGRKGEAEGARGCNANCVREPEAAALRVL